MGSKPEPAAIDEDVSRQQTAASLAPNQISRPNPVRIRRHNEHLSHSFHDQIVTSRREVGNSRNAAEAQSTGARASPPAARARTAASEPSRLSAAGDALRAGTSRAPGPSPTHRHADSAPYSWTELSARQGRTKGGWHGTGYANSSRREQPPN